MNVAEPAATTQSPAFTLPEPTSAKPLSGGAYGDIQQHHHQVLVTRVATNGISTPSALSSQTLVVHLSRMLSWLQIYFLQLFGGIHIEESID